MSAAPVPRDLALLRQAVITCEDQVAALLEMQWEIRADGSGDP